MTRWLTLAALIFAAGCDVCPANTVVDTKFATVAQFHDDVVACANQRDCNQLCMDVFALTPDDSLESCGITQLVSAGAMVKVRYTQAQTCGDDSTGDVVVVVGDDGSTDDPCSDGSCDPPPDDPPPDDPPPDDGSSDDGTRFKKLPPAAPVSRPAM